MNDEKDKENKNREFKYYCDFPFHNFLKGIWNLDQQSGRRKRYPMIFKSLSTNDDFPVVYQEDTDQGFSLIIEIPGISKDDIELEVTSEELWLRAKNEQLNKSYKYHKIFRRV